MDGPPCGEVDERRWRERFERYQASGLGLRTFCAAEGVSRASFYRWKARLSQVSASTSLSEDRPTRERVLPPTRILPTKGLHDLPFSVYSRPCRNKASLLPIPASQIRRYRTTIGNRILGADVQTYKTPSEVVGKAYKGESGGPEVSLWGWDENYLLYSERERLDALGSVAYVRRNVNTLPLKDANTR